MCNADWLDAARDLAPASVHLLYADPPFNTGHARTGPAGTFDDAFPTTDDYLAFLRQRLGATLPALAPAANLLLHVDWRTSHRVRLLLDELLGEDAFVNHLIWRYGLGGSSPRRFARKHDDILFYSLDPSRCWFEPPRVPATSQRLRGQLKKATDVIDLPALPGAAPPGADPPDEPASLAAGDVLDVPSINNMARERAGWPTQKPLALLELLVGACAPPGGTVLDPCCGSGTTLVASTRLGRSALGIDRAPQAIALTAQRLRAETGAT